MPKTWSDIWFVDDACATAVCDNNVAAVELFTLHLSPTVNNDAWAGV